MDISNSLIGLPPHLEHGRELAKTPTGIRGLDEITRGGLPKGRPTLVCGGPGSGKTLLALTFLVNGATQFNEPGGYGSPEDSKRSSESGFDHHLVKPVDPDQLARLLSDSAEGSYAETHP